MPKGVYVRSEAVKKRMKGKTYALGSKRTEESKQKSRESAIKQWSNPLIRQRVGKSMMGNHNAKWKGGDIGYKGVHNWIYRQKGKASNYKCVDCEKQAQEWSNINHFWKRNLTDYVSRCSSCHRKYDISYNNYHRRFNKNKNMENSIIQEQLRELDKDFAKIINTKLDIKKEQLKDYKPLKYATIPKFDQTKQYCVQSVAVEGINSVDCGVEVREMAVEKEAVDIQ